MNWTVRRVKCPVFRDSEIEEVRCSTAGFTKMRNPVFRNIRRNSPRIVVGVDFPKGK
jgi:hypothetical protein